MTIMTRRDALNVLGIALEDITPEITKQAYRKSAKQYHPDRNPAGAEMMQLINAANEVLKDFTGKVLLETPDSFKYGEKINEALNAIMGLGLKIEICGTWIWVSGDTKAHKEKLKSAKYLWSGKKCVGILEPKVINHGHINPGLWRKSKKYMVAS